MGITKCKQEAEDTEMYNSRFNFHRLQDASLVSDVDLVVATFVVHSNVVGLLQMLDSVCSMCGIKVNYCTQVRLQCMSDLLLNK